MKKFLFVTYANQQSYSGGSQCSKRNMQSLYDIMGEQQVKTYILQPKSGKRNITSMLLRASEIFRRYMGALTTTGLNDILNTISKENVTDLFVDSSLLGIVCREVKKHFPNVRIITFFQNIEYDFMMSCITSSKDYLHCFWIPLAKYNEECACRYSDQTIVLNKNDAKRIYELYARKADAIIPISMEDDYNYIPNMTTTCPQEQKTALFVGSYFFGNIIGIKWFCKEALPHINIHFNIVGAGMNNIINDISINKQISIYDSVPDLTPFYEQADFVILPIMTGGGMKVKTAEALKYGKYIIGTREALEGYDINKNIATLCTNANSFIEAINHYHRPHKFNADSRQLFLHRYSYQASLELFQQIIS